MKTITPEMRAFLTELADLIERHNASIEALEETRGYDTFCAGTEFTMWYSFDSEGNQTRELCQVKLSREPDAKEIRATLSGSAGR